jgi:F-type H+-transporting ATPase subunit delta
MTSRAAAIRYARALFDVAQKEGDVQQAGRDLKEFAELVASNEALARALASPAVPVQKKRALVEALVTHAGSISPIVSKLLLLLADRDRLMLLPDIVASYEHRLMDQAKVVRGEVLTAIQLPVERLQSLQQSLSTATGRQVQLENRVDPSIIGGAIARIGSTVYDGSVTTQLEKLKQQLVEAET